MRIRNPFGSHRGGTRGRSGRPGTGRFRLRPEVSGLERRSLLAAAGALDTSFDSGGAEPGVEQMYFTGPREKTSPDQAANTVAIDTTTSDDIVTAGYTDPTDNTVEGISATVGRLTSAGAPDHDFSASPVGQVVVSDTGGYQGKSAPVDIFNNIVRDDGGSVLLDNTSDLILVGYHTPSENNLTQPDTVFSLARLTSAGGPYSPDPNFGTRNDPIRGVATVSFSAFNSGDTQDQANAALLQPDSTILVTGSSGASITQTQIPLARFNFNGTLDTSFNPTGDSPQPGTDLLTIPGVSSVQGISAMAFQGTADVILAGTALVNGQSEIFLVRLPTSNTIIDGVSVEEDQLDPSFGTDGVALVSPGDAVAGLAIDPNSDRIFVAGSNTLTVLTADGAPDSSFGPSNQVSVAGMTVKGMALQGDGQIVLAGYADSSGEQLAALARYTSGGEPDSSFGPDGTGLVTTDIGNTGYSAFGAVAIQPDGMIVAAGSAGDPFPVNTDVTTVIARYIGETPEITGLSPSSANTGGGSFSLTVTGDDFIKGSTVFWNGTALDTSFVDATNLTATVPASDLLEAGPASITVGNTGNITSNAQTFTVVGHQTAPTITWANPGAITYGTLLSSTQLDAAASVPGSYQYSPGPGAVLPAGSNQTLTVTFTPDDTTDYTTATDSVSLTVNQATPTLAVQGASPTYDGNPHPASFTIAGANGDDLTGLVGLTYNGSAAVPVQAGTYAVTATFAGNGDYNPMSATGQIVIAQAVPTIAWADPADIVAGTPLGGSQLDASSTVPGTFTYSLAAGTVLGAGSGQVLEAVFTPSDAADYQSATAQVSINVVAQPLVAAATIGSTSKKGLTSISVLFDQAMDSGSAGNAGNYTVFGAVKKKKHTVYTKRVGVRSIAYNASTHMATITLAKPYKGQLQVAALAGIMGADGGSTGAPSVTIV